MAVLSLIYVRGQHLVPDFVSLGVHVQIIVPKDVTDHLAILPDGRSPDVGVFGVVGFFGVGFQLAIEG